MNMKEKTRGEKHRKRLLKDKTRRHSFDYYLSKAGYSLNRKQLFRVFHVICMLFSLIIPIAYIIKSSIFENGFLFSLWVYFWVAIISYPTVFLITFLLFFIATDILLDTRKIAIEKVFPEFLHLTAANVRAGMPIDQSLWAAVRPKFGILSFEIEVVAKKTMTGEDLTVALKDFSEKYNSKTIKSTISLINEGINAGSEIGDLLENVALSMEDIQTRKDSMSANVTSNVIFISFSVMAAAPLLFAVSIQLLSFVHSMGATLGGIGGANSPVNLDLSMSSNAVSDSDFLYFCYLSIILSSIMANVIIATIKTGRPTDALKKIPGTIVISITLFLLAKWGLGKVFLGLI